MPNTPDLTRSSSAFLSSLANNVSSFVSQTGSSILAGGSSSSSSQHTPRLGTNLVEDDDNMNIDPLDGRTLQQRIDDKIRQIQEEEEEEYRQGDGMGDLESGVSARLLQSDGDLHEGHHNDDDDLFDKYNVDVTTAFLQDDGIMRSGRDRRSNNSVSSSSGISGFFSSVWQSVSSVPGRLRSTSADTGLTLSQHRPREPPTAEPPSIFGRVSSGLRSVGERIGIVAEEPPEPTGWMDSLSRGVSSSLTLSKTQRMYGFGICLLVGIVLIALSMFFLPYILVTAPLFAFLYTTGNMFCLLSTFFIVGPVAQLKNMVSARRIIPSLIFVVSMVLTLVVAIKLQNFVLVMIFVVLQVVSLAWYLLSYIPFGQQILTTVFGTVIRRAF